MNNWQKVINVCFAVIVTLLIYQNNELRDDVDHANRNSMGFGKVQDIIEDCKPTGEIHEYVSSEYDSGGSVSGPLKYGKIKC